MQLMLFPSVINLTPDCIDHEPVWSSLMEGGTEKRKGLDERMAKNRKLFRAQEAVLAKQD